MRDEKARSLFTLSQAGRALVNSVHDQVEVIAAEEWTSGWRAGLVEAAEFVESTSMTLKSGSQRTEFGLEKLAAEIRKLAK